MMSESSMVLCFQIVHTFLSSICAILNLLLIYVAVAKSPKMLRVYSVLVINLATTNLLLGFLNFFIQQRMIPAGYSLALVSIGPCSLFGERICYEAYGLLLHLYSHSFWLLLLSYCYRYWVLIREEPKRIHLQLVILIVYIPSFLQVLFFYSTFTNPEGVRQIIRERYPAYNLEDLTVTGLINIVQPGIIFPIVHIAVISTPIFIAILILRKKIIEKLCFRGVSLSGNTKDLHAQLLKVLTYQAIIPAFYLFGCFGFAISQSGIFQHPAIEYLIVPSFLFVPLLNPITSLVFVSPYKRFVKQLLMMSTSNSIDPTTSTGASLGRMSVAVI